MKLGNGNRSNYENVSDFFPELRFVELQRYAKRWAGKYIDAIHRICLYNYVPKRLAALKEIMPGFAVRYALVFELLPETDTKMLESLEAATEQRETIRHGYPALFDNRFFTVYTDKTEDEYYKHWIIFLRKSGQEMPPGVLIDEPYWILYDSHSSNEAGDNTLKLNTSSNFPVGNLSEELFPRLNPLVFNRRVREWIEKWPLINEVQLYAGKGVENPYVLVIRTADKTALGVSGFWTDGLIPLQQDLLSIHRNPKNYSLSEWKVFSIGDNEELPFEFIHPNNYWFCSEMNDEKNQQHDNKIKAQVYKDESADEMVLWITYYDATREVWLNDCYGQKKLLSRPQFNGVNDNLFAFLYDNIKQKMTSDDLINRGIDLSNKTLHKFVDELGFKGELKRLFFKVSKSTISFNSSVTRKGLKEANIPDSKEELYRLFFMQ